MNFVVATLVTVFFSLSQVLCACPVDMSATNSMATEFTAHSHQAPADGPEAPCDDETDHCKLQTATVAQADKTANPVQHVLGDTTPIGLATPSWQHAWKRVVNVRTPWPQVRSYLLQQTPVTLKVRSLS